MGRASKQEKNATHKRIVKAAAARFRQRGLDGIGVADLMKEAGITVGGFYKHFESREQLVAEALNEAFSDFNAYTAGNGVLAEVVGHYLSAEHRDAPEAGCPTGALLGEIARTSPAIRAIYTAHVKDGLEQAIVVAPGQTPADCRANALLLTCALLGAINLSRAVDDSALSDEILAAVKAKLSELT